MEYELRPDRTLTPLPKQNIDTGLGLERGARVLQQVPLGLRHRRLPADHGVDRRRVGRRLRRLGGGDQGPPHPRRPRARDDLPGRRRRRSLERRPGLRAPAHDPPSRRAGAADRVGARLPGNGRRRRADGRRVPGAAGSGGRDRTDRPRGRGAVHGDARARPEGVRGARRQPRRSRARQAFTLAATYGFPLELTVELAAERGQAVDVDAYAAAMEHHREISRAGEETGLQRAAELARSTDFRTDFVGYRRPRY